MYHNTSLQSCMNCALYVSDLYVVVILWQAIARMKEELGEVEQDSIVAAKPVNSVTNTGENKPDSEKSNQDSEDPSRSASDGDVDKSASTGSSDDNKPATPSEDEVKSKEDNGDQQATGKKDINIEYIPLDLASFESIKNCVRLFKEKKLPLHMLVNNAALLGPTFSKLSKHCYLIQATNMFQPDLLYVHHNSTREQWF